MTEIKALKAEIERLKEYIEENEQDLKFLRALRSAGVDNWEGYSIAIDILDSYNK